MSLRKILNPAGGIIYHMRALRYSFFYWRPYVKNLEKLLIKWNVQAERIVIIGSSGGYSITGKFLRRFKTVIINEPDPLARLIFRLRFPLIRIIHDKNDYITPDDGIINLSKKHSNDAILFSNILGQRFLLCKRLTKDNRRAWMKALPVTLAKCNYFSYHDRISTNTKLINRKPLESTAELTPDELMDHFCGADYSTTYRDHETDALGLPDIKRSYLPWILKPAKIHIIEVFEGKTPNNL